MVEEQKTEDATTVVEKPAEEVKENGAEEKPAENGNGNHTETNGDEKPTENGDDDEGESSEEELGLLEKPVEILTAKRARKSVDVYVEQQKEKKVEEDFDYSTGPGVKLGEIPYIKHMIDRADTEDLHVLHQMMYRKKPKINQTNMVKKRIREFCGWPFGEDSKEFKSIKSNVTDRLLKDMLKWTINLLGLEKDDDMEVMRATLVEFMKKPTMIEKEIPKRKSSVGAKRKSKTPKKKDSAKKKKKSEEEVSEASSDNDSDDEEEKPKKKTPAKKAAASPKKKTPKTPTVKIALPAKKKSSTKKKSKSTSDSEDEAPLKKKAKKPPSDAELKKAVSAILKDADLEQVTMKNVLKQVYDKYTSFDLSDRKDFIKTTVKELIS